MGGFAEGFYKNVSKELFSACLEVLETAQLQIPSTALPLHKPGN